MNDFAEKCSLPMNTFLVERLENYPSMAMDDATAIAIIAAPWKGSQFVAQGNTLGINA